MLKSQHCLLRMCCTTTAQYCLCSQTRNGCCLLRRLSVTDLVLLFDGAYILRGTPPFDSTARAMSDTAAGSCSGGEDCHLSIGFMERVFRIGAGVSGLGAISTGRLEGFG